MGDWQSTRTSGQELNVRHFAEPSMELCISLTITREMTSGMITRATVAASRLVPFPAASNVTELVMMM